MCDSCQDWNMLIVLRAENLPLKRTVEFEAAFSCSDFPP